jgi:predicted Zn-dependent protease
MAERPFSLIVSGLAILLVCAVLWDLVRGASAGRRGPPAPVTHADTSRSGSPQPGTTAAQAARVPTPGPAPGVTAAPSGLSYAELLARSEIRRRIRSSVALTYLNEIVAASSDSMLHRWDDRLARPVRVYLAPGETANVTPEFLNAVRAAFQRWQEAGVPVRWNLGADTTNAEVRFQWKVQIDQQRTGQTDLRWDQNGHLQSALVTLATFDPKGQPLGFDGMRVIALHEIGHVLGLDHSSDTTDLMYPTTKVRDLSPRDIQTALLLYDLAPGSIR